MSFCHPNHGRPKEIAIPRAELYELPEYSCSYPTGTTIGKRWRRDLHAFREGAPPIEEHEWKIAEYMECVCCGPKTVAIAWAWAIDPETGEPHRGDLRE